MAELADEDIPIYPSLGRKISEESKSEASIYKRPTAG